MRVFERRRPTRGRAWPCTAEPEAGWQELDPASRRLREGLLAAYQAGWRVLAAGGDALDAVCASVEALEDDPLFNAGHGAALTASGQADWTPR